MSSPAANDTAYQLQGSGPAVALIHGLGLNHAMWQWQLPALVPHFQVLTYDLLGHGASANPAAAPSLAMFSDQLLRQLDACHMERAAIVGFSLGGMIARRFAFDRPDRLSALAILHSAHARTPAEREAVRERARQVQASGPTASVDAALERWFTADFCAGNAAMMALVRRWILHNDPAVYPAMYRVLADGEAELGDGVDKIACPTLVMTGEEDSGNTPAMARKLAALIPAARVVILPGLRHMALAEAPAMVNDALLDFLLNALGSQRHGVTGV